MDRFEGIYPAVLTPFDADGHFLPAAYEALIEHLLGQGVAGVFACGVVGEGLLMHPDEREAVAEMAVRAVRGRGRVLVHVGAATTGEAIRLARHAVAAGADGVSCVAPYAGSFGPDALEAHFRAVAAAASPLPFLVYYNPGVAPSLGSYATLERILDLPGVTGVKFSGLNAEDLAYCVAERSGRQNVLTGVDEMLLATQLLGADGAIAAMGNLLAIDMVGVRRAVLTGDPAEGARLQHRIIRGTRLLDPYPFIAALKAVAGRPGIDLGFARPPHLQLTPAQRAELLARYAEAGL